MRVGDWRVLMLIGLVALSPAAAHAANRGVDRPNILFLFADDQSYRTIHATGNERIATPVLDELFRLGTQFSHAYNQGGWNGAICIASRTMLVTGRPLWHAHAEERDLKDRCAEQAWIWPQLLEAAGYRTYFTGKWHVKVDNASVFNVSRHVRGGMPQQQESGYRRPQPDGSDPWSPFDRSLGGFWEGGTHWSEVVANDAIDYLTDASTRDEPFFMYIAFNAPHDPRQSPEEFVERYPPASVPVPASFLPEYPFDIGSKRVRDEVLAPFPRTHHAVQVHRGEYYAIISHMDQQIGRILDHLEDTGQRDNTWIFFTADHGLACGEHGLLGKQNQYDHSIRVPFVAVAPQQQEPRTVSAPIYLQSVMPTTLELAGVEVPERVEFESLRPLLSGQTDTSELAREGVYSAYVKTQRSLSHDGWKLILYPAIEQYRLYHTAEDPDEIDDLAGRDDLLPRARRLYRRLIAWQQRTGDELDLASSFPTLAAP